MSSKRGTFILFEGGDRCGKTTQVRLLQDALRKRFCTLSNLDAVKTLRFPDRTSAKTGKVIADYLCNRVSLSDTQIHSLFSLNRWEVAGKMTVDLLDEKILVVDRYAYSGVAYSVAKGLDIEECKALDVGLPQPDIVFYMDIDPSEAAKRGGFGDEKYETIVMQSNVRNIFLNHLYSSEFWVKVDATKSELEIHEFILAHALNAIENAAFKKIKSLWS